MSTAESVRAWWQQGVFYQIYPRSFQDTNADGVGDIRGIIDRLPYLLTLGIDAIWLSPIFPSPMADFGYDISDYTGVDPLFGTMADLEALLDVAHAAGLKVILDLVPNHTSDQHPWFVESRHSTKNPKRDWYIWRDPAPGGGPPNNWLSEFGGSAWQYDAATRQYYYHAFLSQQPDLNWRNPAVRHAIHDVMRFWLRKGVDGFRVDVIWHLIKDAEFRDNPPNPAFREGRPPHERILPIHSADQPEVHDVIAEMRRVIDEYDGRVLIGEIYLPPDRLVAYYGKNLGGAQLPFNFALLSAPWNARAIEKIIHDYEAALPAGAWPNWVLGNHDRPRVASRVGRDQARRSPRCCCCRCGERPRSTTATKSECDRWQSRPIRCAIPSRRMCRISEWDGMAAARRCNGTQQGMRASRRRPLGYLLRRIPSMKTSSTSMLTRFPFSVSTEH